VVSARRDLKTTKTCLQHSDEIRDDRPVIIIQFVLAELQVLVTCDVINGRTIIECHLEHVVSRVPASFDVAGDKSSPQRMGSARLAPSGQGNRSRMNDCERELSDLNASEMSVIGQAEEMITNLVEGYTNNCCVLKQISPFLCAQCLQCIPFLIPVILV
jgi:hypothetical protein